MTRNSRYAAIVLVLLFSDTAASQGAHAARAAAERLTPAAVPLPVDVALNIHTFADRVPMSLSSDGRWIAYTLIDNGRMQPATASGFPPRMSGADVWVTDVATGESVNVTRGYQASYSPAWSPDGRQLAFYSDRDGAPRVWLWTPADARLRRVADVIVWNVAQPPTWTPDGRRIITAALPAGVRVADAQRSGRDLIVAGTADREPGSSVAVYQSYSERHESTAGRNGGPPLDPQARGLELDLVAISVATGRVERVVTGRDVSGWWLSPDGQRVAVSMFEGLRRLQAVQNIAVVRLADRQVSIVAPNADLTGAVPISWAPDGTQFVYATSGYSATGDLMLVSLSGGQPRNLTPGRHPNWGYYGQVGTAGGGQVLVWDSRGDAIYATSGNSVWRIPTFTGAPSQLTTIGGIRITGVVSAPSTGRPWVAGPNSIMVVAADSATNQEGFYAIDLAGGTSHPLLQRAVALSGVLSGILTDVAHDGRTVAIVSQDATHPPDIWVAHTPDLHDLRQLTHINAVLEHYAMGASRLVAWRGMTGANLRGTLLLPPGYDSAKRYPVVIDQYPGTFGSESVFRYGATAYLRGGATNLQLLATRGYIVLVPDVPFEHYGARTDSSVALANGMQQVADAILPGVSRLIELGIADPKRLGVMGCSFGGWSTVALLTQSRGVFQAAIAASGGSYDWPDHYGELEPDGQSIYTSTSEFTIGGTLWERRDAYVENSPLFYLDRVETPLLLTTGGRDIYVGHESAAVFVGLRRLGREVEYAEYGTGGHCPSSMSRADQADYVKRMIRWFNSHLQQRNVAPHR